MNNCKSTRANVAPINFIYGSHFSDMGATYEVSQNIGNFVKFRHLQEVDVSESPFIQNLT